MCRDVVLHEGDKLQYAGTQGELANRIGYKNVIVEFGHFDKNVCLCPVDLRASANKAGWEHSETDEDGEYDPFDFHWYKKT